MASSWTVAFLGPGWVEVEPGIYEPPSARASDDPATSSAADILSGKPLLRLVESGMRSI